MLHTRVPEALVTELKLLSESLRIPVSSIVRAAIEDVLQAAQATTRTGGEDVRDTAGRLTLLRRRAERYADTNGEGPEEPGGEEENDEGAERPGPERVEHALRGVIGFQPITLARATRCALCGRDLAAGEAALMAIRDHRGRRIILGSECLPLPEQEEKPA